MAGAFYATLGPAASPLTDTNWNWPIMFRGREAICKADSSWFKARISEPSPAFCWDFHEYSLLDQPDCKWAVDTNSERKSNKTNFWGSRSQHTLTLTDSSLITAQQSPAAARSVENIRNERSMYRRLHAAISRVTAWSHGTKTSWKWSRPHLEFTAPNQTGLWFKNVTTDNCLTSSCS